MSMGSKGRIGRGSGKSLAGKAYREIKEQILTAQLRPGQMIAGNQFTDSLKMSRTPIQEALKLLCKEGLLQVIPRVGYVVKPMTLNDLQEVFQLRLALETLAVELAAERVTTDDLAAFERMEQKVQKARASLVPGTPKFLRLAIEANRDFHLMVANLSGNGRLVEIVKGLLDESQRILPLDPRATATINFMGSEQHHNIFEALQEGDAGAARQAMASHIAQAQQRIAQSLLGSRQPVQPNAHDETPVPSSRLSKSGGNGSVSPAPSSA